MQVWVRTSGFTATSEFTNRLVIGLRRRLITTTVKAERTESIAKCHAFPGGAGVSRELYATHAEPNGRPNLALIMADDK